MGQVGTLSIREAQRPLNSTHTTREIGLVFGARPDGSLAVRIKPDAMQPGGSFTVTSVETLDRFIDDLRDARTYLYLGS